MASLSLNELSKRNNFQTFVYRIAVGQGFYIVKSDILIKLHPSILENINDLCDLEKYKVGKSIQLPTVTDDFIPLSMLYKDSDFSSRTQNTTAKQDEQIQSLKNEIEKIKQQHDVKYVSINVANTVYDIKTISSLNDKSKADFCLIDKDDNEVCFISHKHGISPRDFQQWSGTSKRFQQEIFDHPETQDFIHLMQHKFNDGLPTASSVARKIQDVRLKNIAVFGNDFGKEFGKNNVNAVMQGILRLTNDSDFFTLSGSHYTIKNGDTPLYGYEPVFMAVHKKDRSDHWIKNCRITINPIGSRKIKTFL